MEKPVSVSVVIPLYNAEDVIEWTIKSVVAQTWSDREIIVIDDGSTDRSADVVKSFGDQVRYWKFDNGGVAKARNRGINLSRGRYIALLDHDDVWAPTKLAKQAAVLDARPEVGLVLTNIAHLDAEGRPLTDYPKGPPGEFFQLFVKGFGPTPSTAMIRRSVLDKAGGFDERFASAGLDDHEFWPRLVQYCEVVMIDEPLMSHRHRHVKPREVELEHRGVLYDTLLKQFGHHPEKRRYLLRERAAYLADLGKWRVERGELDQGRQLLRSALRSCMRAEGTWKTAWRAVSRLARSYG